MKVNDFLGNKWDIDCVGCAISNRSMLVPGGFIQRTQYFCVHQDPLIPLPGFLVIASLRHIQSISEMEKAEYEDFCKLVRIVHFAIKETTKIEYFTIVQEERSSHFHLWFFPWIQNLVEQYGQPSLTKIREIMADYRKQPVGRVEWQLLKESIEKIKTVVQSENL